MAQRGSVTYLGALYDPAYGIDAEGVLFCTQQDAVATLYGWLHGGDGWREFEVLRPDGRTEVFVPPALTGEARILLWQLGELDRTYAPLVAKVGAEHGHIDHVAYMALPATHAVWVGDRGAVRHGVIAQFEEQYEHRTLRDVREAGSVVVTDA